MKTIKVQPSPFFPSGLRAARAGDVFHLFVHGCRYTPEIRAKPPRVRVTKPLDRDGYVECELIDEWPDAPEYWPPESAPKPTPTADQGRKAT